MWADWQLNQTHWDDEYIGYVPTGKGPNGVNFNDSMLPWKDITPARVANFYLIDTKGYKYDKYFRAKSDRLPPPPSPPFSPIIKVETIPEVDFNLITSPFEKLAETLRGPVFPID